MAGTPQRAKAAGWLYTWGCPWDKRLELSPVLAGSRFSAGYLHFCPRFSSFVMRLFLVISFDEWASPPCKPLWNHCIEGHLQRWTLQLQGNWWNEDKAYCSPNPKNGLPILELGMLKTCFTVNSPPFWHLAVGRGGETQRRITAVGPLNHILSNWHLKAIKRSLFHRMTSSWWTFYHTGSSLLQEKLYDPNEEVLNH